VRTNYYQRPERPVLAIKVECAKVEGMVSPRPLFEIYVHSRLLEGIHLRGGKVARGGIRWSDRHDDFRTEAGEAWIDTRGHAGHTSSLSST